MGLCGALLLGGPPYKLIKKCHCEYALKVHMYHFVKNLHTLWIWKFISIKDTHFFDIVFFSHSYELVNKFFCCPYSYLKLLTCNDIL